MASKVARISESMRWEIPEPEPNHRFMGLMFEGSITPTKNLSAGFVVLPPKQEQRKLSAHEGSEEVYFVVRGKGQFVMDDDVVEVEQGTAVYISPGCRHRAINTGSEDMELFWVNTPSVFGSAGGYLDAVKGWTRVR
jgi:mannose-6-phosphate isomerase-like protein (cupin superfamily)